MSTQDKPLLCYLGHAGFALMTRRTCLLMDPWLSGTGAFLHTWFPFPDNTGIAAQLIPYIGNRRLYVYVSHAHEDHCDPGFLRQLDGLDPVYVLPHFDDDSLRRVLRFRKGKRVYLADSERFELDPEFAVTIFIEESGINTDSAILAESNGRTLLNINDCKIYDRVPEILPGPIDTLTGQFSGATWHPLCYTYDQEAYRRISHRRKNAKFYQVYKTIRHIDPEVFVPSAGPPVFLHPALFERNFDPVSIFAPLEDFTEFLRRRTLRCAFRALNPGEGFYLGTSEVQCVLPNNPAPDLESYRLSKQFLYCGRTQADPASLLSALFQEVSEKLERFETHLKTRFPILIGVMGAEQKILVDLNRRHCALVHDYPEIPPIYSLMAAPEAAAALVAHELEWENFCLTFLLRIRREPDEYCPLVNLFFFCTPGNIGAALRRLEQYRNSKARIEIATPEGRYSCRRFCPHQGADLTHGYAQGGFWVCPRHRWRFDLNRQGISEDGSCSIDAAPLSVPACQMMPVRA